jgi:hypothetical protein
MTHTHHIFASKHRNILTVSCYDNETASSYDSHLDGLCYHMYPLHHCRVYIQEVSKTILTQNDPFSGRSVVYAKKGRNLAVLFGGLGSAWGGKARLLSFLLLTYTRHHSNDFVKYHFHQVNFTTCRPHIRQYRASLYRRSKELVSRQVNRHTLDGLG